MVGSGCVWVFWTDQIYRGPLSFSIFTFAADCRLGLALGKKFWVLDTLSDFHDNLETEQFCFFVIFSVTSMRGSTQGEEGMFQVRMGCGENDDFRIVPGSSADRQRRVRCRHSFRHYIDY